MKLVGMIPVFNEEDIIEEVIKFHLSQGLELVILDNGSTDNSYEICRKYLGNGVLKLERYQSKFFRGHVIFRILYDIALTTSPDWIILIASDEFLESGIEDFRLKDAISKADNEGNNLIQFDRFDFFMTDNDNEFAKEIRKKLTYYSYQDDFVYRAWKYFPGIIANYEGGHYPIFPVGYQYKISPRKLFLRHYIFRSKDQAEKKMKDRMMRQPKILEPPKEKKSYYQKILSYDFSGKIDHRLLNKYEDNNDWNKEKKFTKYTEKHSTKEELFTNGGNLRKRPVIIPVG